MASSFLKDIKGLSASNYTFPAIRGIQAGREYYICMCHLKLIPRIFLYDESDLPAELRAQRTLNRARIPDLANYLVNNPGEYVFSSITASIIDAPVTFIPFGDSGIESKVGTIVIPMDARFLINDGQHRRAAIEEALKIRPEIGNETISVVLFLDAGLKRSQQMFSDLNRHAVRPTRSISILYDHRDPLAALSLKLAAKVPSFQGLTELEKTSLSNRSIKMFTLSSIYQATQALLGKKAKVKRVTKTEEQLAIAYWSEVGERIPEWQQLIRREVTSCALRRDCIHAHGVALQALGIVGHQLVNTYPANWQERLDPLREINWARSNVTDWEGRTMIGGRISKTQTSLALTANLLKEALSLPLTPEEAEIEERFHRSGRGGHGT